MSFAFDLALDAARDLYTLSNVVEEKHGAWVTAAGTAKEGWEGGRRDTFDHNLGTAGEDASEIKEYLRTLADLFATNWADARGEQDRINWARWVQSEKDDDNYAENAVEWVAGEDDYGDPPGNPETPSAPDYWPTRDPIRPEFENRSVSA